MGANIGTSVTNTIVAMGHFNNPDDLRRGFAAATVHDCFNLLSVAVFLPLNWIYPFLEKMTYEMTKDMNGCDEDAGDKCKKTEFLKPYVSPYSKGIANYNKDVSKYVSQNYCMGLCDYELNSDALTEVSKIVCAQKGNANDCSNVHGGYSGTWMSGGKIAKKRVPAFVSTDDSGVVSSHYSCPVAAGCDGLTSIYNKTSSTVVLTDGMLAASTTYAVCPKMKNGLCDKRLLKGGIALTEWKMTDAGAGTFLTIWSLGGLCACLFCIVYALQIIIKGGAARVLKKVIGFNPYLNMLVGMGITIMVQSSSITTATLTPIAAVGLITLEEMFPLTLGANIGTTLTGIMGATVATSNPGEAMQVALCHLFFNLFGILLWYPVPAMRNVPLNACRFLGRMTAHPKYGQAFPLVYTATVFLIIPGICYGIAAAATA
jgi:sodium-dependent phosphate cotransporter